MKPVNKLLLVWALLLLSILQATSTTIALGTDLLIQYVKSQQEKNNNVNWKYKLLSITLNLLMLGAPYIAKISGKLIKKASDKITEYINNLKK